MTPQKSILDTYQKHDDFDSDWFKAAVWQTKKSGVQTMGVLAFVMGIAMSTNDRVLQAAHRTQTLAPIVGCGSAALNMPCVQIRSMVVLIIIEVGNLYVLCTLQYSVELLQAWHVNVSPPHNVATDAPDDGVKDAHADATGDPSPLSSAVRAIAGMLTGLPARCVPPLTLCAAQHSWLQAS